MNHQTDVRISDQNLTRLLDRLEAVAATEEQGEAAMFVGSDQGLPVAPGDHSHLSTSDSRPGKARILKKIWHRFKRRIPVTVFILCGLPFGFFTSLLLADLLSQPAYPTFASSSVDLEFAPIPLNAASDTNRSERNIALGTAVLKVANVKRGMDATMDLSPIVVPLSFDEVQAVQAETVLLPTISMPRFLMPLRARKSPFPVQIGNLATVASKSILLLSGFPDGVTFSHGKKFGENVWAVHARDASTLSIAIAESLDSKFDLRGDLLIADSDAIPHDVINVGLSTELLVAEQTAATSPRTQLAALQASAIVPAAEASEAVGKAVAGGTAEPSDLALLQPPNPVRKPARQRVADAPAQISNVRSIVVSARQAKRRKSLRTVRKSRLRPARTRAPIPSRKPPSPAVRKIYNGLEWDPFPERK